MTRKEKSHGYDNYFSELIEIFNTVPEDVSFKVFYDDWLRDRIDESNPKSSDIPLKNKSTIAGVIDTSFELDFSNPGLEEEWFAEFQSYPRLRDFLLKDNNSIFEIDKRLESFLVTKNFLEELKTALVMWHEYDTPFYGSVLLPGGYIVFAGNGGDGEIKYDVPNICDVIKNIAESGEIKRIRMCKECDNLFWAFRLDAKYCSKTCSNRFWQKEFLSDPSRRAENNEKRKQNYERNKQLKEMKEKNNGGL